MVTITVSENRQDEDDYDDDDDEREETYLEKLPGEVRNLIYEELISCRDLALMRTSWTICEEMTGLVLKLTPYRLYVNYPDELGYPRSVPDGKIAEGIQQVEIYWRPLEQPLKEDERPCVWFGGSLDVRRPRRKCVVYLERLVPGPVSWVREQDLDSLSSLSAFEEVVFRVNSLGPLRGLGMGVWALGAVHDLGWDEERAFLRLRPRWKAGESVLPVRWKLINWDRESWDEDSCRALDVVAFQDGVRMREGSRRNR